jgi:hypothetical protein
MGVRNILTWGLLIVLAALYLGAAMETIAPGTDERAMGLQQFAQWDPCRPNRC